jgi:hypothetical protein
MGKGDALDKLYLRPQFCHGVVMNEEIGDVIYFIQLRRSTGNIHNEQNKRQQFSISQLSVYPEDQKWDMGRR